LKKHYYRIKFGKHKGKSLDDIPFDYLRWLAKQDWCPKAVINYLKKNNNII
tara:strand:- start:288 stop:440 length:153 start_codon:yes stop_codon:yes gene_type:complete